MGSKPLEVVVDPVSPTAVMRRAFDAPRGLVFDAFTKPELVTRWKAPRAFEVVICEVDMRAGGKWQIKYRAPDGAEFGLQGEILEVDKPASFSRTVNFVGKPGKLVEKYRFEEQGGKTTVTTELVYESLEARDALFGQGVGRGMEGAYALLDELLLQQAA